MLEGQSGWETAHLQECRETRSCTRSPRRDTDATSVMDRGERTRPRANNGEKEVRRKALEDEATKEQQTVGAAWALCPPRAGRGRGAGAKVGDDVHALWREGSWMTALWSERSDRRCWSFAACTGTWTWHLAWQHERARRLMMSESMTEAKGARVCPNLAGFTAESTESTTKRCPSP